MIDVCLTDGLQKPRQQLHYLPEEGVWYVHCKHCEVENRLNARNEEEAYGMLHEFHQRGDPIPSAPARTSWGLLRRASDAAGHILLCDAKGEHADESHPSAKGAAFDNKLMTP